MKINVLYQNSESKPHRSYVKYSPKHEFNINLALKCINFPKKYILIHPRNRPEGYTLLL